MSNRQPSRILKLLLDFVVVALFLAFFFGLILSGCKSAKDRTIPTEPTIWVVSEIYEPKSEAFHGMIGYKFIPVNPGSINAKPTWKLDYKGKYYVGQRVDFMPIASDTKKK